MKKFTKELGPGWITLVENDDYALSRLIFGDGLEVDCDEEETPLLRKGFQQIQEYWTGHRVIFTLPLAPGGSDFEREVWETVIRIPYGEHFTTPTLLAARMISRRPCRPTKAMMNAKTLVVPIIAAKP